MLRFMAPIHEDSVLSINAALESAAADIVHYDLPADQIILPNEPAPDDRYYFTPGDYFLIPDDEIRIVNMT